jgi:uncharacterized protein YndB with AHSA1/START domain
MRTAQRGYLQSLRCDAPVEQIWQALVRPEALRLWHADDAVVEARQGGRYSYRSRLFGRREAHIDVFEPGRRLRLLFDPNPSWPAAGNSVIVEDFLLDTRPTGTRKRQGQLRLLGSGVPSGAEWDAMLRRLQAGWAVAFSHLQRRLDNRELERLAS